VGGRRHRTMTIRFDGDEVAALTVAFD